MNNVNTTKTTKFDDMNPIGAAASTATQKRVPDVSAEINGLILVMTFKDGSTVELNAGTLSEDIQRTAMMHGLKQKLGDAAAISRNTETGRAASIGDKFAAVREVADRLTREGQWNKTREGGGSGGGSLLLRALCELQPRKTREQLVEWLATKTDKEKAALRASETIAAKIASYKASDVDVSDLLAELE